MKQNVVQFSRFIGQLWCGLWQHHDFHKKCEDLQIFMECANCGQRSSGIEIDRARTYKLIRKRMTAETAQKIVDMKRRRRA